VWRPLSLARSSRNRLRGRLAFELGHVAGSEHEGGTRRGAAYSRSLLGCGGSTIGVASNTGYTRDNKGQLVEERLPGVPNYVPCYYLFDGLGSVVGLTDG
jgi:hypothetical protein